MPRFTNNIFFTVFLLLDLSVCIARAGTAGAQKQETTESKEPNALELYSIESSYVGGADIGVRGHRASQEALANDISYGHRIPLFSQWYLRLGVEYQRFDFGRTETFLPTKLQALSGTISVEYVEQNFIGAALTLHPGFYFEDEITRGSFDMPVELYSAMKINEKFYLVLGVAAGWLREYPVVPIGGPIWLITDTVRLEGIFPRPSLVWVPSGDWEYRLIGEVLGGGFLTKNETANPNLRHTPVQYSDYRLGAQAQYARWKPFKITLGAGWSFERVFEYVRTGEHFQTHGAPYAKLSVAAEF
jgi:hypothetical protein